MCQSSAIVAASQDVPLLSLLLKLDMAVVREILSQEEFHALDGSSPAHWQKHGTGKNKDYKFPHDSHASIKIIARQFRFAAFGGAYGYATFAEHILRPHDISAQ
jgi:hypothetical protein